MFFQKKSDYRDMNEVRKILEEQHHYVKQYLQHNDPRKFCTVRNGPCVALDFFSWKKDKEHLYISANSAHCTEFFRMPKECIDDIRGKSDVDLINAFRERTGKVHSYGELCYATDEIVKKEQKHGHFIEVGFVGDELFVLDTYKTPVFDSKGSFAGTEGYAFNKANRAKLFEGMIENGIKNKCLEVIEIVGSAACYKVKDHCSSSAFLNGFPSELTAQISNGGL